MSSTDYILPRDKVESARLNNQHVFWTKTSGYLIHPDIASALPHNALIADVAAGTGIWALDVAREWPDSHLTAFDISDAQFPPSDNYAGINNIQFKVHDARQTFPTEYHGKYDLVHVRSIIIGMNEPDWASAATNLRQLLKPGGALQWTEGDMGQIKVLRNSPIAVGYHQMSALLRAYNADLIVRDLDGPKRLPDVVANSGMQINMVDSVASDRVAELRSEVTRSFMGATLGWAARQQEFEGKLEQLAKAVNEEITAGAYLRTDFHVIIANRPR